MRGVSRGAIRGACMVVAFALGAGASAHDAAHPHEPDAEELALGAIGDAEYAFERDALARGIEAAAASHLASGALRIGAYAAPQRGERDAAEDGGHRHGDLHWQPAHAGVARSHDFGYVMGPWELARSGTPGTLVQGAFLRLWRRDHGRWQVLLSANVRTPAAVDFVPLGAAPRPAFARAGEPRVEARRLITQERSVRNDRGARTLLAQDVRVYRDGEAPRVGADGARVEIDRDAGDRRASDAGKLAWVPVGARMAPSADVAVTWGSVESGTAVPQHVRHYVHVWLRDAQGRWRIAIDMEPGRDAFASE